ncbi:MAG: DUF6115 domain-containing protein [Clostridiaceae bacterium]
MIPFLIIIGLLLIFINYRALKKDSTKFKIQLNNRENNMSEFQIELGQIRKDFSEKIAEIEIEIDELKNSIEKKDLHNNNISKIEKAKYMISDGYNKEEIAKTLGLSKGEISLIKDLYK